MIDNALFKEAMRRYPSGVVIATTCNAMGLPRGFTASSFTAVSMEPAMVLVCLSRGATCHPDFQEADYFALNFLRPEHQAMATRFAMRGADKFTGGGFSAGQHGLPVLLDALAHMVCRKRAGHVHGDHTVFVGEIEAIHVGRRGDALARYAQEFTTIGSAVCDAA